jgi:Zn-dependent protease with chaperone function
MHLIAILILLTVVWLIRQTKVSSTRSWLERWRRSLFLLLFPPLLLLTSAIAIMCMGCSGSMLGIKAGWLGYTLSAGFLIFTGCCLLNLVAQGDHSLRKLATHEQKLIGRTPARILDLDFPYSAQIGFWNSELVISRGLLTVLDEEHLAAVFAHEQAHVYYRDTFWFFWLGWVRSFTFWLPNTELLWQELLLLRELRADRQAAQQTDSLLLAESLLTLAKAPFEFSTALCANFSHPVTGDRLNQRIDFLLAEAEPIPTSRWQNWSWICLLFLPLLTIPLHY